MNRLGASAAGASDPTPSDVDEREAAGNLRGLQQNSSGTVEALQQRMLLHLNRGSS